MREATSFVGLDTSKKSLAVAVLYAGMETFVEWGTPNEPGAVRRMVRKIAREARGDVVYAYEAGPCGYVLQRQIESLGSRCMVIAPSLIPRKPGERIKTDRRDARKLAENLRNGSLTEVRPPSTEQESARDLVRCREDLQEDLVRLRHRLSKLLLRRGLVFRDGRAWTQAYRRWLRSIRFENATDRVVFDDSLLALDQGEARLVELERTIDSLAASPAYREAVGVLCCMRGVRTVAAATLLTELHNPTRFQSPRALMSFVGLVPSESSSAERRRRGSITKTGNAHVRRILVEIVHSYRHRPAVGPTLRKRREGQPEWAIALADKAQQRLHRRYQQLLQRGKPYGKVIVALAREFVGFLWAAFQALHQLSLPVAA